MLTKKDMKRRKGISTLVATVLLILIVVAAAGLIWGVVMPMINRMAEINQACLDVSRITINTGSGYTCYDSTNNEVSVMIGMGVGEYGLAGVQIIIGGAGGSKKFDIHDGGFSSDDLIKMYGQNLTTNTTELVLEVPAQNEERTYIIDLSGTAITNPDRVEAAPIVKIGQAMYECQVISKDNLPACT